MTNEPTENDSELLRAWAEAESERSPMLAEVLRKLADGDPTVHGANPNWELIRAFAMFRMTQTERIERRTTD